MSKKPKKKIVEALSVLRAGSDGKSIAQLDEKVVLLDYAVPGDVVDVEVTRLKRSYMEGRVLKVQQASPDRREPFCEHFGTCGGCRWQHMDYEAQLGYKQQQVQDALTRIGKVTFPEIIPIMGSEKTRYYRNKLEFTFSDRQWISDHETFKKAEEDGSINHALGFHIPKKFDKILDIQHCYLQADPSNEIRLAVKQYAVKHQLSFFNLRSQEGLMRNLIIRTNHAGEVMVIVCFYFEDEEARKGLLEHLQKTFPKITSLFYVINEKRNDTIGDQDLHLFSGKDHLIEEMEDLRFKIGPKSFFQTNTLQALELYRKTREFAGLTGNEIVYDLYTGVGTIANFVAKQSRFVLGLEYVEEAVSDSFENAQLNQIDNVHFLAGDMKDILTPALFDEYGHPEVIITDPPRAGMHESVVKQIIDVKPQRIVYVSCNPASQARDLAWLDPFYKIEKVQPVDMFPQTHHVENIVLLHQR